MAKVVITIKIMPNSPDTDMDSLEDRVRAEIEKFGGDTGNEPRKSSVVGTHRAAQGRSCAA